MKRRIAELPLDLPNVSRKVLARIRAEMSIPHLTVVDKAVSPFDHFAKYLFKSGAIAGAFEAVRIPLMHRPGKEKFVVCVSAQVGCAAKCAFCETGKMGFMRNLSPWEIVDQVVKIQADSSYPVRGVVFMGMGEPFLNYKNVVTAANILRDPSGLAIDAKSITISTVGVTPMIRRFTAERLPYRLIVSVHAATAGLRDRLVPMNSVHPLPEVIESLREYQAATGRRVILAWTMMAGVNMGREQVRELARLTHGMDILLDLIPVNDVSGTFRPPSASELADFLGTLREELACPISRRYSGGKDVAGACGMLVGKAIDAADSCIPPQDVPTPVLV